jgi:SAM-dependent methyltransferase
MSGDLLSEEIEEKSIEKWWVNSDLRAFLSKALITRQPKFFVNCGVGAVRKSYQYSERLVELPFVFRNIRDPPADVLDIGCVESIVPIQLSMLGYRVTGIDIRNYYFRHRNFAFARGDFNLHDFRGKTFDIVIDVSSVEHFGLRTFSNTKLDMDADKKAVRRIYDILKPHGQLILTAPFGIHRVIGSFQRVYDKRDIEEMLKNFRINTSEYYHVKSDKSVIKVSARIAGSIEYDTRTGEHAIVMIDATKV